MAEDDVSLRNVGGEYRVIRETADGTEERGPLKAGSLNTDGRLSG